MESVVSSNVGVLASLISVAAFFFALEQRTRWKLFEYLPPLIFIYFTPVLLGWFRFLPSASPVYDSIRELVLPAMLIMLLLKVDVGAAVRIMGKGVGVMLFGTLGVVVGAPIGYAVVATFLESDAWEAFGILAGSWIGGTGNMAAMAKMLEASDKGTNFGLAVLGDTVIYIGWLPLLLGSRRWADWFLRFTRADPERVARMEAAAAEARAAEPTATPARFQDHLYVLAVTFLAVWAADQAATWLDHNLVQWAPQIRAVITRSTWQILAITTLGIGLSFTRLRRLQGSHELAMALVYLFVARMGAVANLSGVASQAVPFLLGCTLWIVIHGICCVFGAWLLRVDIHTAAIASAANIGGAASAPIVATAHREGLVPVSILMALIGYAVGNYAAFAAAMLCRWVAAAIA